MARIISVQDNVAKIVVKLKSTLSYLLKRKGQIGFVKSLPHDSAVLDVGCGNYSPFLFKTLRPDIYYIGLDICDYGQATNPLEYANRYIISNTNSFASEIAKLHGQVDAVVSNRNIAFCDQPDDVMDAMLNAIRPGGRIYLCFPCEEKC